MLLDEFGVPLAGRQTEPHRQLLDDVEDRDEQELQGQQPIAPLRAALRRGDDAAGVGVREHHDQTRSGDDEKAPPTGEGKDGGT